MSRGTPCPQAGRQSDRGGTARRWLAVALAMVVLAACQHGDLTFSRNTGSFHMPLGAGSSNRND